MKNDEGFTLIELILVFAIISILAGMAALSLSVAFSAGAKQCAADTSALLSRTKIGCMSHADDTYMVLFVGSDDKLYGQYFENGSKVSDEPLSNRSVTVSYRTSGAGEILLSSGSALYISFNRWNGELKIFGNDKDTPFADETKDAQIIISAGSRVYTIVLDALTGNHSLEG